MRIINDLVNISAIICGEGHVYHHDQTPAIQTRSAGRYSVKFLQDQRDAWNILMD